MAPRPTKKSPGLPAPQPPPRPDLALQARPPAHPDLSATPRPAAATMECMAQMMGGKDRRPSALDDIPTSVLLTPAMASTLRPRRSPGLARCRLATRVAAGLSPAQAARAEGL